MIDQLAVFAAEVMKVAREVGTEGKLGVQAEVQNMSGVWQDITYVSHVLVPFPRSDADRPCGETAFPSTPWPTT